MRNLSKSKLMAYRQCPKRLWLEIHHPELRADSAATEASFAIGHQVGDIARQATEKAVAEALAPLVAGAVEAIKARVEGELLGRLDNFARTELPAHLTAHAEQIVWRVVPTIAEDLVKEEIKRLTSE